MTPLCRTLCLPALAMLFATGTASASQVPEGWSEEGGIYYFGDTGIACHPAIVAMTLQSAPVVEAAGMVSSCHYTGGGVTATIRIRRGADYGATNFDSFALPFDPTDVIAGRWDMLIDQNPESLAEGEAPDGQRVTTIAFMKDEILVECILASPHPEYTWDFELGFLGRCTHISGSHRPIKVNGSNVTPAESMAETNETAMAGNGPVLYAREPFLYRHPASGSFCPLFADQFYMFKIELLPHQALPGGDFNCKYYEFDDDDTLSFFITSMPKGTTSEGFLDRMRSYLEGTYKAPMRTDYCESPDLADGTPVIHAGVRVKSDDPDRPGMLYYVNFQALVNGWSVEALLLAGEDRLAAGCATAHNLIADVAVGIVHSGFYERPVNQPR